MISRDRLNRVQYFMAQHLQSDFSIQPLLWIRYSANPSRQSDILQMAVYLFFCRFSECYGGKGQQRATLENHTDADIHTSIQC